MNESAFFVLKARTSAMTLMVSEDNRDNVMVIKGHKLSDGESIHIAIPISSMSVLEG